MFSKVPEPESPNVLEICYKVGSSAFTDGKYDMARKWLERAVKLNDLLGSDSFQGRVGELRPFVLCTLGRWIPSSRQGNLITDDESSYDLRPSQH